MGLKMSIEKFKKRVNPRISKDISNIIKPYWELIDKSSDYYKLRALALDVGRINVKVKEDVERLLEAVKLAAWAKIDKKIKRIHGTGKKQEYNLQNLNAFLSKHEVDIVYATVLRNAIKGSMVVNLSLEDFMMITNNAKTANFFTTEIASPDIDKLMKSMLKGMKNAILILTGNEETTLDELDYVWQSALKQLPRNSKTAFAYKIDDVDKLQLNLMATK